MSYNLLINGVYWGDHNPLIRSPLIQSHFQRPGEKLNLLGMDPMISNFPMGSDQILKNYPPEKTNTSWWFQPNWKTLVKMGIFPK